MTVGVGYKTENYFVCFTDIQLVDEQQSRHYNFATKIAQIKFGKNQGLIYSAGTFDAFLQAMDIARTISKKHKNDSNYTLDTFVQDLVTKMREHCQKQEEQTIEREKYKIHAEQNTIEEKNRKKEYTNKKLEDLLKNIKYNRCENSTALALAFYDGHNKKIRTMQINDEVPKETHELSLIIGAGTDDAGLYFSLTQQKINTKKLTLAELLYTVSAAYNFATANRDVEGTPDVGIISKNKTKILPAEESAILTNAAAARILHILPWEKHMEYCTIIQKCLHNKTQRPEQINCIREDFKKATNIDIDITKSAIKTNTWGELAVKKIYKSQTII